MSQLQEKENIYDTQDIEIMSLNEELQKTNKATEQEEKLTILRKEN